MTPATVFDVRGLSKTYHMGEVDVRALRDVTLTLPEREPTIVTMAQTHRKYGPPPGGVVLARLLPLLR